jgi:hypothetical protein
MSKQDGSGVSKHRNLVVGIHLATPPRRSNDVHIPQVLTTAYDKSPIKENISMTKSLTKTRFPTAISAVQSRLDDTRSNKRIKTPMLNKQSRWQPT